ncbi:MAG: SusD/RagB family nutrient-binding outer membrane lipoprotein [Bacteroidaceae bacterium]|nr:SusD/RagB family nutrient-binding outer membrane lipoprotein [Bacteroidaceae bacterium]
MKSILKLTFGVFAAALVSATMVSCSEDIMDKINEDRNHATDAPAKYTLAEVIVSSAWENTGSDLNTYAAVYVEHEAGVDNQMNHAEMRNGEPSNASTYNNSWSELYRTLRNLNVILSDEEKSSDPLVKGVAEILTAYNLAILTDLFGDVPFSESFNPDENKQPKLDSQQELYGKIFNYLDAGIADVNSSTGNSLSSYDLIYGGAKANWVKFANALKARYTMRQLKRNGDAALNSVLQYIDQAFASEADQATFNVYDANQLNPHFDFEWSRDGLGASKSAFDKLAERNDPRINRLYWDGNSWAHLAADELSLFENGVSDPGVYKYSYTAFMFAQTADTYMMSYREQLFLKAEALVRLGRTSEAEPILKEAIELSFANLEASVFAACTAPTVGAYGGIEDIIGDGDLTAADADAYFDAEVKPRFAANPLKETLIQKYLSMWGANGESLETYNDVRRLISLGQESLLELKNPKSFPLRYTYGSGDTTTNPNVNAAYGNGQYVYSEPVWWAGGSR